MIFSLKLSPFVGNSFFSFFSSSLVPDFFNRFGFFSSGVDKLFNLNFYRIFVEFSFKLPFENVLSKFKNRIHFVLYYLFFELIVSQKPRILVRRERLNNLSSFKNKREIKKAKESIGIQGFSFNVSLTNPEQINKFLLVVAFFVAPFTDKKLNPPSKYVPFALTTSQKDDRELFGSIKNLSIFPTFNLIDDLTAFGTELRIKFYPFNVPKEKTQPLICFFSAAYGISIEKALTYLNLRSFKL